MSKKDFTSNLIEMISQVTGLYYRLILAVGLQDTGKTRLMQMVHKKLGAPLINLNLELSKQLLDLTERQRSLSLPKIMEDIVGSFDKEVVLLDNIEVLFDVNLKQDPLKLLQNLSRNRTIVGTWNGTIEKNNLIYAVPDHPEYRKYPIKDILYISMTNNSKENIQGNNQ
jgi:hypothetical protein